MDNKIYFVVFEENDSNRPQELKTSSRKKLHKVYFRTKNLKEVAKLAFCVREDYAENLYYE